MRTTFSYFIYILLFCFGFPSFLQAQEEQVYIKSLTIDDGINFYNEEQEQYVTLSDFLVIMDNTIHVKATASVTEHLYWVIQADFNGNGLFDETIFSTETESEGSTLDKEITLADEVMNAIIYDNIDIRVLVSRKEELLDHKEISPNPNYGGCQFKFGGPITISNASGHQLLSPCLPPSSNRTALVVWNNLNHDIIVEPRFNTSEFSLKVVSPLNQRFSISKNSNVIIRLEYNKPFGITRNFILFSDIDWWCVRAIQRLEVVKAQMRYEVCSPSIDNTYENVSISPNPFTNTATISYFIPEGELHLVTIEVYNLQGILVQSILRQVPHGSGNYKATIGGLALESGTYLVKVQIGETVETYQVTKH